MTTKIKQNHKKYSIHKAEKGTKNKLRKKKTKSEMIRLKPPYVNDHINYKWSKQPN